MMIVEVCTLVCDEDNDHNLQQITVIPSDNNIVMTVTTIDISLITVTRTRIKIRIRVKIKISKKNKNIENKRFTNLHSKLADLS